MVWQEITARRRPGTMYAAFFLFITPLHQPIIIDESAEAALVGAARKELAYLEQFGQPLLPLRRQRRAAYQYQERSPSDHIENLNRYLLIASSLVPRNPTLCHFRIRHPDLQPGNIVVSRSFEFPFDWQVVGLLDWQHASILPPFLLVGIPDTLQNYGDPISESMTPPSLPENIDELEESEQTREEEVYRRRLVHYHYLKNTVECNKLHYAALTDNMGPLRSRLFSLASHPWEGETLWLKVALIQAMEHWEELIGGEGGVPCPVVFDAEDVRQTMELNKEQEEAETAMEECRGIIGHGPQGWVPTEHYEEAMARSKQIKADTLAEATSEEERANMMEHWPWDDMDEEKYR